MRQILMIAVVGCWLATTAPVAWGQTQVSVRMVQAACNYANLPTGYQEVAKNMCMGHLRGFLDYHNTVSVFRPTARLFCLPPAGTTLDTIRVFFMQAARTMSEEDRLNTPAGFIIARALMTHFPCDQ